MTTQQVESCVRHLQHPDEATKKILDLIQVLAAHGVCYALTVKKPMQCNWLVLFHDTTIDENTQKGKSKLKKRQKTLEHRVVVEQLLGEVVLILF